MEKSVKEGEVTKLFPRSIAERFKVVREIGRGAAGSVYEGVQLSVDRRVAIKVLHSDHQTRDEHVERFTREAKALARLSHTNCVTLFDFGFSEEFGSHYMVMEFIEGEELFAITRERQLPFKIALRIAIQVSEALAHAHKHGILHRDLKPENVLVTADWEAKVLDFGLARLLDMFAADAGGRRLTAQGAVFGTPAYMSPEQCAGDLDVTVRSDIYSLGVMMYELFEGRLPFDATDVVKLLVQHASATPPPMSAEIPDEVKTLVMEMLAKDPKARPRTGTQVAERLRAVLINMPDAVTSADISQEIQRSLIRELERADQTDENPVRSTEDGLPETADRRPQTSPEVERAPAPDLGGEGDGLARICETGRAPTELAVRIARDVAQTLAGLHAQGRPHLGVNPSNILVCPQVDGTVRAALHDPSGADGKPAYRSPEQRRGQAATPASDIYALGVVLYRLLSGNLPFEGKVPGSRATPLAEYIREVPPELSNLIATMVESAPGRRPSANDVVARLDQLVRDLAIREVRVGHQGPAADLTEAWRLRRPVAIPSAGAGQTVSQRSVTRGMPAVDDRPLDWQPSRSRAWVALVVAVLVIAALVAAFAAFGGGGI